MFNPRFSILLVAFALFAAACTPAAPANTTTDSAPTAAVASQVAAEVTTAATADEATAVPAEEATAAPAEEAPTTETAAEATMSKLNLNIVSGEELLATIPDFGNRMVREFQEYRPYVSIQQFRREIGKYVDDAQVAFYEEYVYVPVNVNDSDAATLMQIPGVDEAAADALLAARPYDTSDAFLQTLAEVAPGVNQTVAQAYLETE
ncbi:MAG TPA: hypothetical protein P5121_19610 [Caldilineaceae bacterium]|nr:hypothetical protein [Caldilineaceae bacterium]